MMKEYKKVEIEWVDSKFGAGWEYLDEIEPRAAEVRTIGHLISEDEVSITLAHSISEKQCCGRITIPKVCIKSQN